jgi:hypothetical protein
MLPDRSNIAIPRLILAERPTLRNVAVAGATQLANRATTLQQRRREALRCLWSRGSFVLLSVALSAVLFAFVFYDYPIIGNTQIISYLRGAISSPTIQ